MISLYDSQITDILPINIKNLPEVQAISYAVSNMNKKILNYANKIAIYTTIDTLNDDLLDLLAIELNTQYYDEEYDIEIKRKLIKNSFIWWMKAGTTSAVEELISIIFGEGEIEEWFNYGGDPFKFRMNVDITKNLSKEQLDRIYKMIDRVKNRRSWLESIILSLHVNSKAHLYSGSTLANTAHYILTADFNMNYDSNTNENLAATMINTKKYTLTNDINILDESISKANQASNQSISLHYELS